MAHFTIDPTLTHVRIVVATDYQACLEAYVSTGKLSEFTAMIDCIAAELDEVPGPSFARRCIQVLRSMGLWLFKGLEIEGVAMYPAAFPADFYDSLFGVTPQEDSDRETDPTSQWSKLTLKQALSYRPIFPPQWNPAHTESDLLAQVPGYDATAAKVTSKAGVVYQWSKMRPDVQTEIAKVLDVLARKFPRIKLLVTDAPLAYGVIAQTQTYDRGIHAVIVFTNADPDQMAADFAESIAKGWHLPSKLDIWQSTAIHEFGHALTYSVGIANGMEPGEIAATWLGHSGLDHMESGAIGQYAESDPMETIAEAYAQGKAGVNPSVEAKRLTRFLEAAYQTQTRFDQSTWNPCVMEVRAGQRSSTMAQAMAHNLSTIDRDLEMFAKVLSVREDAPNAVLPAIQAHVRQAYELALGLFGREIAEDHETIEPGPIGNERNPDAIDLEIAVTAANRAKRYESR